MVSFVQLLWLQAVAWGSGLFVEAAHVKFDFQKKAIAGPRLARRASHLQVSLPEQAGDLYYGVNVSIGTPPQHVVMQLDTGSSNVWTLAASAKACQNGSCSSIGTFNNSQSSTFQELSQGDFSITYGYSSVAGDYFSDVFNIGGVNITNLTMGLASRTEGGLAPPVLGIGPDSLQKQAVFGQGPEVPGVLDGLVKSGAIDRRAFSLYLDDQEAGIGSLLLGGIDTSKYEGDLVALAMAPNSTGQYDRYRVDLTSVSLKDATGKTTILSSSNMSAPSILDSGASQIILPSQLTLAIVQGIGAIEFEGNYFANCSYRNSNASFTFQFGGNSGPSIVMPINQLLSLPLEQDFSNGAQACQLNVGLASESELQFVNLGGYTLGDPLIRNAYLVYDVDNLEVAMAQAVYNKTGTGTIIDISSGSGLPGVSKTVTAMPTTVPATLPASLTISSNATSSGSASATGAVETTLISGVPSSPTFNLGMPTAASQPSTSTSSSGASSSLPISKSAGALVLMLVSWMAVASGWL